MIKYSTIFLITILIIIPTILTTCSKENTVHVVDPLSGNIYFKDTRIYYDYYDSATGFYFDDSTRQRNAIEFYNQDSIIFYQSYLVDYFDGHFYHPPLIIQDTIVHISSFNYKYFETDQLLLLTPIDCLLNMELNDNFIKLTSRKTGFTLTFIKGKIRFIWE